MEYALIKDGVVVGIIVADAAFIATIQANWDACVRVDNLEIRPSPGWPHSGGTTFINPNPMTPGEPIPEEPVP